MLGDKGYSFVRYSITLYIVLIDLISILIFVIFLQCNYNEPYASQFLRSLFFFKD